eukprot:CAMPEP_0168550490 /NCGR_PEP_ID=MMETSP0413-20121227/5669_1 /TAXON_ID=136452 /ORGANISM="Filamoeba nolandi, Strain NC-AS-23-1" /LENGTH=481 /DNA_ID=CAMNT_0008580957 /DNA_START=30 /DNA_END=1472 /DNA_ORIENTATION=-
MSTESLKKQVEDLQLQLNGHIEENKSLKSQMLELQRSADRMMAMNRGLKTKINEKISQFASRQSDTEGMVMTTNNAGKVEMRGGTVEKLVELLYNQDQLSVSEYVDTFLLTFRSYTTSKHVWDTLKSKYDLYDPVETNAQSQPISVQPQPGRRFTRTIRIDQDEFTNQKMRLRIIVIFKRWLEHFYHDFDGELLQQFQNFISTCRHESEVMLLKRVFEVVEKKRKGEIEENATFGEPPPEPLLPPLPGAVINNQWLLENIEPLEIARQLALMEYNLYKKIAPKELLSLSWQKEGKEEKSPNLLNLISHFNQVNNWVIVSIVKEPDIKKRTNILKKMIAVGKELLKLNNFCGVFEVLSGLVNSAVSRLSKTWEQIGPKSQAQYEKLLHVTAPSGNSRAYRELLVPITTACVPYIGLSLTDLVFVEEGNPDYLDTGLVNFSKCKLVADVIKNIQRFQRKPYNLRPVPQIQDLFNAHIPLPEKE